MDNDGSVIVCQLLFTFQISFNSSPSHPHPQREPVICTARAGRGKECQELMIPIIRQKPLFIHHFGSCDPGRPTQATSQTRGGIFHDFTFVLTRSDGEIFKYYLWHGALAEWVCQDCDRSLITGNKLCLHLHWGVITRRYYANHWLSFKKLSSSADIHESWHLRTDDEAVIIRERTLQPDQTLSWVSSSYYASPHQFYISDWSRCWEKTRHEESWEEERADGTTSERCRV